MIRIFCQYHLQLIRINGDIEPSFLSYTYHISVKERDKMIKVTDDVQQQMAIIASQLAEVEYGDGLAAIQKLIRSLGAERFGIDTTRKFVNFQFMFPAGKDGINYVRIELNGTDTYDVYYGSVINNAVTYVEEVMGIYNDCLSTSFNFRTGHKI